MPINHSYFETNIAGVTCYLSPDSATIGNGETKEIPVQDRSLTKISIVKYSLEINLEGLNEEDATAIMTKVDADKETMVQGDFTGEAILLGAFTLNDARPVSYAPTVPERIGGASVYSRGFRVNFMGGQFQ